MLARVHFAPIRVLNNFKVSLEFSIELGRAEERREVGAAEGGKIPVQVAQIYANSRYI